MSSEFLEACTNLAEALLPWWDAIVVASVFTGFAVAGVSLAQLHRRGEDRRPPGGALAGLLFGGCLASWTAIVDMLTGSFFSEGPGSILSVTGGGGEMAPVIRLSIVIVMLVGAYQVTKGLVLLKMHADGQCAFWPAVTHLAGGCLCINVEQLMVALGTTLGGPFQSMVNTIFQ